MAIDPCTARYGALLLRLGLGGLFLTHGLIKLLIRGPDQIAAFFQALGLPGMMGLATMWVEIIGGILLILGIMPRLVALLMIPVILGTIYFVHGEPGFGFSNPGGGWEYPAFWALTLLVQALLGDGAYALKSTPCPRKCASHSPNQARR